MKTCLYSTCFLDGRDGSDTDRFMRTLRYLKYYDEIEYELFHKDEKLSLGNDLFWDKWVNLCDNGSSGWLLDALYGAYPCMTISNYDRLEGGKFQHNYPYCWRGIWEMRTLIERGYQKIIFIDTDGYILTKRLANYVRSIRSGWEAFWVKRHNFPESAFHVLCEDAFPLFLEFTKGSCEDFIARHNGKTMENILPFTRVNKDFNTDRYGESLEPQTPDMDFYGQASYRTPLKFEIG